MTATQEQQTEALTRAQTGMSQANYEAIFDGFSVMGIDDDDIRPRVNIFTYNAWRAKGRQVQKGQHGVKITTWIPCKSKDLDPDTGQPQMYKRRKIATVFHVTQTEAIE